jgi:hypothetical protein
MQKPACIKVIKRKNGNDAPMAALSNLISGGDTFCEQARASAKRHKHFPKWICALYKYSINIQYWIIQSALVSIQIVVSVL